MGRENHLASILNMNNYNARHKDQKYELEIYNPTH